LRAAASPAARRRPKSAASWRARPARRAEVRAARIACAVLALAAVACGYKSSPIAPELVKPTPPPALRAVSTPNGIELRWTRPSRYSGGKRMRDLGGFEISRAAGDDPLTEFKEVKRMELDDQLRFRPESDFAWLDRDVAPGVRYRYRVVAFTLDGYHSKAATVRRRWNPKAAQAPSGESADDAGDDGILRTAPDDEQPTPAVDDGAEPDDTEPDDDAAAGDQSRPR